MGHTTSESPKRSEGERNCWMGQRTISSLWCLLLCLLGSGNREQSPLHTRVQGGTHTLTPMPQPGPPPPGPELLLSPPQSHQNPWKNPSLHQGTGVTCPQCTLTQAPPKRKVSAPWISLDKGKSWQGSPREGSQYPRESCGVGQGPVADNLEHVPSSYWSQPCPVPAGW